MRVSTFAVLLALLVGVVPVFRAADGTGGKIVAGKPRYVAKTHDAWKERGRIVGVAEGAPSFTVAVFDAKRKKIAEAQAEETAQGRRAYELWLAPGVYTLLVTAPGYEATDVHKLEIRAGADLRIDLSFRQ